MSKRSSRLDPKKLVEPPGHTLHRLVAQHMSETGVENYTEAMRFVVSQPDNWPIVLEYQNWALRLSGHE